MNNITEIGIVGIDEERPPSIRKAAYIDLFFRLSAKAPEEWCEDFNALGRQINPSPKINKLTGECIETYVRDMDLIAAHLDELKQIVSACNQQYRDKLEARALALAASNASLQGQDGKQNQLNQIIAALDFGR